MFALDLFNDLFEPDNPQKLQSRLLAPEPDMFHRDSCPTPWWTEYNAREVFAKLDATKSISTFREFSKRGSSASDKNGARMPHGRCSENGMKENSSGARAR